MRKHHQINLEMNAVLLSMLEHANSKTGEISVGVRLLVDETGLYTRSVTNSIDKLVLFRAIQPIEKVKHGRTWVNAYRPTLFGMQTDTATNAVTCSATSTVTRTSTSTVTRTANDSCDAYGTDRHRENTFPQVTNKNRESSVFEKSLQPEPEPKPDPKPKPYSTEGELGLEARQQILEYAIHISLKKKPTKKEPGDAFKVKKRKEFGQLLDRILPTVPQGIIDLFNLNPYCYKAEAFGELIQCRFEDTEPDQRILDLIFCDPYPKAIEQLPPIFKNLDT